MKDKIDNVLDAHAFEYDIKKNILKVKNANLKDFKNNSEFWKNYSNPIESITKSGYDKFLKFNNISEGIKSYNQSVSLIINYLKKT